MQKALLQRVKAITREHQEKYGALQHQRFNFFLDSISQTLDLLQQFNSTVAGSMHSPQWIMLFDCNHYTRRANHKPPVIKSQWSHLNSYNPDDITLSVHTSLDRYTILDEMIKSWKGPISASIFVGFEHLEHINSFVERVKGWLRRDNVDLHFIARQSVCTL